MNPPSTPQLASNFLAIAHSLAKGYRTTIVWRLSTLRGWTNSSPVAAAAAARYLVNAGFAFWGKDDGDGDSEDVLGIVITGRGWVEAEKHLQPMSEPQLPPPAQTINIHGSNIGGIQQGTTDSIQTVHQEASFGPAEVGAVQGFVLEARQNLESFDDPVLRSEVEHQLDVLEEEASRDEPRGRVIAEMLEGLKSVAYGVAGSGTWQVLHTVIDRFL